MTLFWFMHNSPLLSIVVIRFNHVLSVALFFAVFVVFKNAENVNKIIVCINSPFSKTHQTKAQVARGSHCLENCCSTVTLLSLLKSRQEYFKLQHLLKY